MSIWTVTTSGVHQPRTLMGMCAGHAEARRQMVIATGSLIERGGDDHPRYELSVDGEVAAIIHTGDDESGLPDHRCAAGMLAQLDHVVNPYVQ
ncbi:hypothetical protein E2F47_26670 [Mycobacterium eburneum]|nr:hypothetical protein [Mycobacterium eburneum]TDH47216.1 hypothetical protein E2F47_26670 [Mycobacterium eburneum]